MINISVSYASASKRVRKFVSYTQYSAVVYALTSNIHYFEMVTVIP